MRKILLAVLILCPGWTAWGHLPGQSESTTIMTGNPNGVPSFGPVELIPDTVLLCGCGGWGPATYSVISLDVLPPLTFTDHPNHPLSDGEFFGNLFITHPGDGAKATYFDYIGLCYFCEVAIGTLGYNSTSHRGARWPMIHTPLSRGVPEVVSIRSGPQVVRIPARRIVSIRAVVTDQQAIRDRPLENRKRDSMYSKSSFSGEPDNAIAILFKAWPYPTLRPVPIIRNILEERVDV